jgi:hypothetical protein
MVCDSNAGVCVLDQGTVEAGTSDRRASSDTGAQPDVKAGPQGLGGNCIEDKDCESGLLCGTSTLLTASVSLQSICTKLCCTSDECADGFVCYGTGTGGNYCISAALGGLGPLGKAAAGAACAGDTECRSGVCSGGHCRDSCCRDGDCRDGMVCGLMRNVPGPHGQTHTGWTCSPGNDGGAPIGDPTCGTDEDCLNNLCLLFSGTRARCLPSCCNAADCALTSLPNGVCAYNLATQDQSRLKWCLGLGGKAAGESCTSDIECASRFCDGVCMTVCCRDSDCASGEVCKPSSVITKVGYLGCVKAG